jgi:streptogramin lyase
MTRLIGLLAASLVLSAAPATALVPGGIALEADGSIVVVGSDPGYEVIRIDSVTGVVTTVSSSSVGSGPSLDTVSDVAVEASGSLVVTLPFIGFQKVLRVDPVSGDRSVVSDPSVGSGPVIFPRSIAVAAGGELYVTQDQEFGTPGVVRVDPSTGDRFIVSGPSRGAGPAIKAPTGIVVEPGGSLAVTEQLLHAVLRIDPGTGDRTIVSGADTGSGPDLRWVVAITAAPDGTLLVADRGGVHSCIPFCPSELCQICIEVAPSLVRIDPGSGDRTTVSGGGSCLTVGLGCVTPYFGRTGLGRRFLAPTDVAVEDGGSYVVADTGLGDDPTIVRVDPVTGRRRVLAHLGSASAVP